jgi:2-polyprenyl-3-methyl-5-hydroxy-6-metoxy-1,4-benzoquinol methylase
MTTWGLVRTSDEANDRVTRLIECVWVLAAVVRLARSDDGLDAEAEGVLVAAGLASRGSDGRVELAQGIVELLTRGGQALGEQIASAMGQAIEATKRDVTELGWNVDDATLLAQGRASAAAGRLLATSVASQLPGLSERLAQPGAYVLDVGTGVAELACALADALPTVQVVGIDVLERALDLADQTITERGLADRVQLRLQSVADVAEAGTYELVWLPLIFIPPDVVREALPALRASLRPGGWLVASLGRVRGSPLAIAVKAWQTQLASGTALTPERATALLEEHGFADVTIIDTSPSMPTFVAGRHASP